MKMMKTKLKLGPKRAIRILSLTRREVSAPDAFKASLLIFMFSSVASVTWYTFRIAKDGSVSTKLHFCSNLNYISYYTEQGS